MSVYSFLCILYCIYDDRRIGAAQNQHEKKNNSLYSFNVNSIYGHFVYRRERKYLCKCLPIKLVTQPNWLVTKRFSSGSKDFFFGQCLFIMNNVYICVSVSILIKSKCISDHLTLKEDPNVFRWFLDSKNQNYWIYRIWCGTLIILHR